MRDENSIRAPALAEVERMLSPDPLLEADLRAFVASRLARVLPAERRRGADRYFEHVVLGRRALDAFRVLHRHRPDSGLPVVDVGCGLGSFVLLANAVGMPALGFEPGDGELELARRRADRLGIDRERFRHARGQELPLGEGEASGVLLQDVLEHVPDWRAVLREARRVLAPTGVLYVKGPSYAVRFFEPHYRVPWLPLLPRQLARRYLRALGRDAGYLDGVVYVRRGPTLAYLRDLGFELSFPRLDKLRDPGSVNRAWARKLAATVGRASGEIPAAVRLLAENPLQATIDVVARKPSG